MHKTSPAQRLRLENAETYPLISVIIPTFNRAGLLPQTLRSVMDQTYRNIEILLADDGSTDLTAEVVSGMNDPRIRFYTHEHTGHPGLMRNRAATEAKGEFLAFIDSDDLWISAKLQLQYQALVSSGKSWSYGNYEHFPSGRLSTSGTGDTQKLTADILMNRIAVFIGTLLVRRDLFNQLGRFREDADLRFRGDFEFVLRLSLAAEPVFVPEILTRVREHEQRSTSGLTNSYVYTSRAYEYFIRSDAPAALRRLARRRQAYLLSESAANKKAGLRFGQRIKLLKTSFGNDKWPHWLHCLWRTLT